jgi:hypothetical protein
MKCLKRKVENHRWSNALCNTFPWNGISFYTIEVSLGYAGVNVL